MKNFALIGAAGYIAPRHMKAIKETGNNLIAALDKNDSVGIIDSYFPDADFFTEYERFDRHLEKLKRKGIQIDYISICSPNYLHDSHIRFGLRHGADVICEKPLVLTPWNIEGLKEIEQETGKSIYTILQLRLHPAVIELKKRVNLTSKKHDIDLTYITSRGNWYYASWKGDQAKSGGITTNIGIHFFDILTWIFGKVKDQEIYARTHDRASGFLKLERANVKWFLSINESTLPEAVKNKGGRSLRSIKIDGTEIELDKGFENLHTMNYSSIINDSDNRFGVEATRECINLAYTIRTKELTPLNENSHPLAHLPLVSHPFNSRGTNFSG